MERRQERLLARRARDEPDAPAPRSGVEQFDGARRMHAENFQPRDLVAQLNRQIEGRLAGQALGEIEIGFAERGAFGVIGPHPPIGRTKRRRADQMDLERADAIVGGGYDLNAA